MGVRLSDNLKDSSHEIVYLEKAAEGIQKLLELGINVSRDERAIPDCDVVILAVPDTKLGDVSDEIVPKMKKGAMVYTLDPACALAGKINHREDLSYFRAHPAHPSICNWEPSE